MPRVETVVNENAAPQADITAGPRLVFLYPNQIVVDPLVAHSRPAPLPPDEDDSIKALAKSLLSDGQIVPCIVEQRSDGACYLIDGGRRLRAARLIDAKQPFQLVCAVGAAGAPENALRLAIHANLKRRGYTALQFANLCAHLRETRGWEGTREVALYLGVSRAQVSEHDKLLHKPEGMEQAVYDDLLAKVAAGGMRADAAFYALTHVEPAKAGPVLQRATEIAKEETAQEPLEPSEPVLPTPEGETDAPAGQESQGDGKEEPPATSAETPAKRKREKLRVPAPEWMKGRRAKAKARRDAEKAAAKAAAKAAGPVKVEKKHIRQAAKEAKALKADKPLQKTPAELRKLLEVLRGPSYPDVMRNFISILGDQWWRGDALDQEVIERWNQIRILVEEAVAKAPKSAATKETAAKKTAKAAPKKSAPKKTAKPPAKKSK
jgi:ParB-like chromosome segregation protein Spo0J